MALPPRDFYTLKQVSDKLTRELNMPVTINDLICYWLEKKLTFSIYIAEDKDYYQISEHTFLKKDKEVSIEFESYSDLDEVINLDYFQYNNLKNEVIEGYNENDENKDVFVYAGLFSISSFFYFLKNGINPSNLNREAVNIEESGSIILPCLNFCSLAKCYLKDGIDVVLTLRLKKFLSISLDCIFILNHDLECFLQNNGKKEIFKYEEKENKRKEDNQKEFLKKLIKAVFDVEEAEKARTLINGKGNKAKIANLFAQKGIELNITGETLKNWFK